jgi:hypothetical protein
MHYIKLHQIWDIWEWVKIRFWQKISENLRKLPSGACRKGVKKGQKALFSGV